MAITLSDTERQYIGLFESVTGAIAVDCVVDADEDRVLFVVATGEMDVAIGPNGRTVKRLQDRIGKAVELVEDADSAEAFVANALAPAAVYGVEIEEEGDDVIAVADVDEADKGAAIGSNGRNVAGARLLADRHFGVTEIRIE